MGQLRNKCVQEWPGVESGIRNWTEWVLDESHWHMADSGKALLCGNVSGARYIYTRTTLLLYYRFIIFFTHAIHIYITYVLCRL